MRFNYLKLPELPKNERKLVGFILNDVCYGLPIMAVREVINPRRVTKVPSMPAFVLGMAEHRNDIIPVVDLRARFNIERAEQTRRTKWIIAIIDNKEVGIEVDRVTEVATVDPTMKKDKPLWTMDKEPWIAEIFQTKSTLIFELNLPQLIDSDAFSSTEKGAFK
jgi:purine-binding chemotaxis protein CheW